ncbi:hypothetical protein EDD22DRAFT_844273 [Suillus occidentalis]|nr:hypothetical protein EDD22DRAFT_844273 [Suillus occidentalis]
MSTGQLDFTTTSIANKKHMDNFVSIDQWTLLAVKPIFKGQRFHRYDMSLETQLNTFDSNFGNLKPGTYEKHFAGVTEVINELSAMFDKDWAKTLPALTGQSPTPSVNEEIKVDHLIDDNSPSYDLGWTSLPAPTEDDTSTDMEGGKTSGDQDDEGPTYDLEWGAPPSVEKVAADDKEDEPNYDLGWGVPPSIEEVAARDGNDNDDGPTYNLE